MNNQSNNPENKKDYSATDKAKSALDVKLDAMKASIGEKEKEKAEQTKLTTELAARTNIKDLMIETEQHIKSVESEVLKYAGKVNYNPFVWLRVNNFYLAKEILKSPNSFDETTIRNVFTKVLNTKAEPPVVVNPIIPSVKQILKTVPKTKED